jgi:hypothetical protein
MFISSCICLHPPTTDNRPRTNSHSRKPLPNPFLCPTNSHSQLPSSPEKGRNTIRESPHTGSYCPLLEEMGSKSNTHHFPEENGRNSSSRGKNQILKSKTGRRKSSNTLPMTAPAKTLSPNLDSERLLADVPSRTLGSPDQFPPSDIRVNSRPLAVQTVPSGLLNLRSQIAQLSTNKKGSRLIARAVPPIPLRLNQTPAFNLLVNPRHGAHCGHGDYVCA